MGRGELSNRPEKRVPYAVGPSWVRKPVNKLFTIRDAKVSENHHPLAWLADSLRALESRGLRRKLGKRGSSQGPVILSEGRELVNFGANDYLGLASHPRLARAATDAIEQEGWGAGASPLVTGRSKLHAQLERRLAEFEDVEAALVFPSGFAANAGVIPALTGPGDAILWDAKNHASLIDGCRLSRAESLEYAHCDVQELEQLLKQTAECRRRLIVTDTLFSMDGDFAPLDKIAELSVKHNAMLLVDEAHATGVWGKHGRGLVEQFAARSPAVEQAALIRVGTLSKALGCGGGFVAGSRELIDFLANRARSYVFSTAQPAANSAAALAALELVKAEPERRKRAIELGERLRAALREDGWDCGRSESQIVPVILGDNRRVMQAAARLRERGLWVPGIRPPTVPQGQALLRVSLSAAHTDEHLERLVEELRRLN